MLSYVRMSIRSVGGEERSIQRISRRSDRMPSLSEKKRRGLAARSMSGARPLPVKPRLATTEHQRQVVSALAVHKRAQRAAGGEEWPVVISHPALIDWRPLPVTRVEVS